ncbi:MHYT domain-containing protein [Nocardia vulneris]|uniref:MHYT domain-containing protein n=1 Tax=Nocardia vulneris TaxID=1141657 RepID=UPI0030D14364
MSYFTMGYWIIGLSVAVSMVGALIGFACIRQSTMSATAQFRAVWQVSAAISIGGIGAWLPVFVSMLGVAVPGSLIRYDVTRVAGAALAAVLAVWAALVLLGRTTAVPRLILAGVVMGGGLGLMHYLALDAVRIQGSTSLDPLLIGGAVAIAIVVCLATLWFVGSPRSMPALAGAALLFAAGVAAMHYTDLAGLQANPSSGRSAPSGEDLFGFFVPVFVIGMLSLAIPISAILVAPDRRPMVQPRPVGTNSAF